ncbi:MAG: hypothetical protein ABEJ90_00020 [Halobacterium sp.]
MNVDWSVESVDGMALVTVELHNPTPVDRRVRVENELAGDVLPPRRQGVVERGWDDGGYGGVVAADDRVSLGYACPAPVERPPVTVSDEGRADGDDGEATANSAIRELGDPSPPADAVPLPTVGSEAAPVADASGDVSAGGEPTADADAGSAPSADDARDAVEQSGAASASDAAASPDVAPGSAASDTGGTKSAADASDSSTPGEESTPAERARRDRPVDADATPPQAVASWLRSVERRIEHGEGLTDASVVEAADVLESAGGLDAVASLPESLAADAETLRAVAAEAERLAERAEAADVPVDALRRLA